MKMHAMTSMKNLLSGQSAESPSPIQNGNGNVYTENSRQKSDLSNKQMHVHAISNGHMPSDGFTYGIQSESTLSSKDSPLRFNVQSSSNKHTSASSANTEITSLESTDNGKGGTATPGQVQVDNLQNQSENNNTEVGVNVVERRSFQGSHKLRKSSKTWKITKKKFHAWKNHGI